MTKLNQYIRPTVIFDPANPEHREHYLKFIREGSWGNIPVQFITSDPTVNQLSTIERQLINFYVSQEFA